MASDLNPDLRQAIDASSGPLELVDRKTDEHFFVIRAETYERLKAILDLAEATDAEKTADLKDWARRSGYFDPSMDGYDSVTPQLSSVGRLLSAFLEP